MRARDQTSSQLSCSCTSSFLINRVGQVIGTRGRVLLSDGWFPIISFQFQVEERDLTCLIIFWYQHSTPLEEFFQTRASSCPSYINPYMPRYLLNCRYSACGCFVYKRRILCFMNSQGRGIPSTVWSVGWSVRRIARFGQHCSSAGVQKTSVRRVEISRDGEAGVCNYFCNYFCNTGCPPLAYDLDRPELDQRLTNIERRRVSLLRLPGKDDRT